MVAAYTVNAFQILVRLNQDKDWLSHCARTREALLDDSRPRSE